MKNRPRRKPGKPSPWFRLHDPARPDVPWAQTAGWVVIAVGALALLFVAAWLHPVGDYWGETDFYGGYVEGARLFQAGRLDPARYGVVGPLYDMLLAIVAWAVRDFFTAAKLIAVASAVGTWILWRRLVADRLGDVAALWATAFLVANPVLFQSGYSAVSHGVGVFLQVASLAALLTASPFALLLSGGLTAMAALIRYPGLVLLPAAWVILGLLEPPDGRSRWRSIAIHLAGFLIVMLPWVAFSLSRGQVPAQGLFGRADFYLTTEAPHVQDAPGAFYETEGERNRSLVEMVRRNLGGILQRAALGAGSDRVGDARELLGYPVALLVVLGLALTLWDRTWKRLLALGIPWLLHAIVLAPVYYNSQYALVLLPFYATLAGAAIGSGLGTLSLKGIPLKAALALIPLALAVRSTIAGTRFTYWQLPIEVREAGLAAAATAGPDQHVLARKGHIGYYGRMSVVPFPRVETLQQLADYCRERDVRWIYYSWYEALLRPELQFLLDTTAMIPGLEVVHETQKKPSRLFRRGPGFGAEPPWWNDERQRRIHVARGAVQVLSDHQAWNHHLVLAYEAANRQDARSVLEHAEAALRGRPQEAIAWALRGAALHSMGRTLEARDAYRTALRLQPGIPIAEKGLRMLP